MDKVPTFAKNDNKVIKMQTPAHIPSAINTDLVS